MAWPDDSAKWFNVMQYGAFGDNNHDDSAAIQAAMQAASKNSYLSVDPSRSADQASTIYFPPGTYVIKNTLNIPNAGNFTMKGDNFGQAILKTANTDLFTVPLVSGGSVVYFEDLSFVSNPGGGHIYNATTAAISFWRWQRCQFIQNNDAKSIFFTTDATFINCTIDDCQSQHTLTATQPSWWLRSSSSAINNNYFRGNEFIYSGLYHISIESTGTGYNQSNVIMNSLLEVCNGGFVRIKAGRFDVIRNATFYDAQLGPNISNDVIAILAGGVGGTTPCWGTVIDQYVRVSGTLAAGINDIKLATGKVGRPRLSSCGNSIDLGVNDATLISMLYLTAGITTTVTNRGAEQEISPITLTGSAALAFGTVGALSTVTQTIGLLGGVPGQSVSLGFLTAPPPGIIFNAYVSSAGTVTVTAYNPGAAGVAVGTITVRAVIA